MVHSCKKIIDGESHIEHASFYCSRLHSACSVPAQSIPAKWSLLVLLYVPSTLSGSLCYQPSANNCQALAARTAYAIGLHRTEVNASFGLATHKTRSVTCGHMLVWAISSAIVATCRNWLCKRLGCCRWRFMVVAEGASVPAAMGARPNCFSCASTCSTLLFLMQ